jgi:hypothetical protein
MPQLYLADAGIPMIFLQLPAMVIVLMPVVALEAFLISRWLNLTYKETVGPVALANVASTLLGVPLAWGIALVAGFGIALPLALAANHWHWTWFDGSPWGLVVQCILGMAWLGPVEGHVTWMIPLAAACLLVPSYFISVWCERQICRRYWHRVELGKIRDSVQRANLISYACLLVLAITGAIIGAIRR